MKRTYADVLLVPQYSEVSRKDVSLVTLLASHYYDIPFIASPMHMFGNFDFIQAMDAVGGIAFVDRFHSLEDRVDLIKKLYKQGFGRIAAAVGVKNGGEESIALCNAGARLFCIDVAHGDHIGPLKLAEFIRHNINVDIIGGSVVTKEAVRRQADAGVDIIRVGIGPGSICRTRIETGVGFPQFDALRQCVKAANKRDLQVIADGGIQNLGDISKALAAGADAVMMGRMFAGADEASGEVYLRDNRMVKEYFGMGSNRASAILGNEEFLSEGVESAFVPLTGALSNTIEKMSRAVRSTCGYMGALTIAELQNKAKFVTISSAALQESHPHNIIT